MKLAVQQVSQGIYRDIPSEDVVGYLQRDHSVLAWAIDGASTLTPSPFTTFECISDAGWFARELADVLRKFQFSPFSPLKLREDLDRLRQHYRRASEYARPLEDWPVAAATIAEIDFSIEKKLAVSIYRYADCFDLIHQGPLPLPIDGKTSVPKQPFHDPWKPCSGFQGEVLDQLRQRRRQQQRNEFSTALTLNPESALNATETRLTLDTPAHILLGTDGLSRLWDTYGLMTREQAQRFVSQRGLLTLLETLRDFELTAPSGGARGKRRDDASGISLSFL